MHYMVNGTTPYPLTSYYTSYAAEPKCVAKPGDIFGGINKAACDISETWIVPSFPKDQQQKTRDVLNSLTKGPVNSIGTSIVNSNQDLRDADKNINTIVDLGGKAGGASDFLKKYGIYLAAGGGLLLVMMMFMMFKR